MVCEPGAEEAETGPTTHAVAALTASGLLNTQPDASTCASVTLTPVRGTLPVLTTVNL